MSYPSSTLYPGTETIPEGSGTEPVPSVLYPGDSLFPSSTTFTGTGTGSGGGGTSTIAYPGSTLFPGSNIYPGVGSGPVDPGGPGTPEGRLVWGAITERQIETGVDRGVIYLKDGTVAVWNGLTAIDEEGGEGAVEYYIDGRPFLYFPKPKEFKATLQAYTYPDEFSQILGETEITDGMYLDSQMGDSFGLCYRTKIIDPLRGESGNYKIHLIYNATVVPSAKSFGTIGDSINPVEFSWDIQAVPVRVPGYRSTAHVIIDTQHMDAARISQIETILYGNPVITPSMPLPHVIFDLLNFGDSIIITDNGDGTWTAEGSYENVVSISSDIFEIRNANANVYNDGTYQISSTA